MGYAIVQFYLFIINLMTCVCSHFLKLYEHLNMYHIITHISFVIYIYIYIYIFFDTDN